MKVVLRKDVPGLGGKHDVKSVADGYAANFLLPRKLAVLGTEREVAQAKKERACEDARKRERTDALAKNLESLEGTVVALEAKANAQGHFFAGVHRDAIAEAIEKQTGISVPPECVELPHPLKEAGEHAVAVRALGREAWLTVAARAAR